MMSTENLLGGIQGSRALHSPLTQQLDSGRAGTGTFRRTSASGLGILSMVGAILLVCRWAADAKRRCLYMESELGLACPQPP